MLDLHYLTKNIDAVIENAANRRVDVDFERLTELLEVRRDVIQNAETARHQQRLAQQQMKSMDKSGAEFAALRGELKAYSVRVKELEEKRKDVVGELEQMQLVIPNMSHQSVPIGADDSDNELIRTVGTPRAFGFAPLDHADLGENLGLLDFERAAKVTGSRFTFLRGTAAHLSRTLINLMLDLHVQEHGYEELLPPFMVNRASMTGTGQLPKFEEDSFKTDDYFLVPTAEVPVTNFLSGEILDEAQLPLAFVAYTPCFRREAGSYGVDTKGLIRQHQFDKVELVRFVHPDTSYQEHELLLNHAEKVLQLLELPYRVVSLCSGDITFSAAKCYDLEVWIPSQNCYREISSCSNFEAFQARRGNIRFRPSESKKPQFVHTMNGSGLAIGRTIVALMENYQNEDGSISLPEVLAAKMGVKTL